MKNILRGLAGREKAEKEAVAFYETCMKDDIVENFSQDHRKEFVGQVGSLCDDSRRHGELVRKVINKYDKAKLFPG